MHDEKIGEFLDRLADRVPAPGGGAAAALQAALGAALIGMVARYTTGEKYAEHAGTVSRIIAETDELRSVALRLAVDDQEAFGVVGEAYKLPRSTDAEKAARSAAIAQALAGAARPPAELIGVAGTLVGLAEELTAIGNRNVISDVGAGAEAVRSAAQTARVNVEVNLSGVRDEQARAALAAEAAEADAIIARAEQVTEAVRGKIRA